MNALMREGNERLLLGAIQSSRDKCIGVNDERILCTWRLGVRYASRGRAGVLNLVYFRDVGKPGEPEQIIYALDDLIR